MTYTCTVAPSLRTHGTTALVLGPGGTAHETIRETLEHAGAKLVDEPDNDAPPDICCALLTGTAALDSATVSPPLLRGRITAIAAAMAVRGAGRLILVFDGAGGVHTATPDNEVSSRAADIAWWRQLAARVSARGVRANQIRIGMAPFLTHRITPERTAAVLRHLPLRRVAGPADLAAAILHLASEGCSYTVAETVPLDGGMELNMVPPLRTSPAPTGGGAAGMAESAGQESDGATAPGLFDLTGRHCLVVGASSGMGRETALELARRGADVTVLARRERELDEVAGQIAELGRRATTVPQDVSRLDELDPVVERLWRKGRIDAMVYATGLCEAEEPGSQPALRERALTVNFRGYATLTDALVRRWAGDRHGGAVVALGSAGAGAVPHLESYAASKAAMAQYTRSVAVSGGRHGIRANCVMPGLVATPMAGSSASEDFHRAWLARIPAARAGTPQDVAPLVAYLAGDSAGYVTGAQLYADGGLALGGLPPLCLGSRA